MLECSNLAERGLLHSGGVDVDSSGWKPRDQVSFECACAPEGPTLAAAPISNYLANRRRPNQAQQGRRNRGAQASGLPPRANKGGPSGANRQIGLVVLMIFLFSLTGCGQSRLQTQKGAAATPTELGKTETGLQSEPAIQSESDFGSREGDANLEGTSVIQKMRPEKTGWHVFRGDTLSSGVASAQLPAELEVLWEYKVPGGNASFEGTPVIARHSKTGVPMAYIGDLDGTLFAFELETGDLKWKTQPKVTLVPPENPPIEKPSEHEAFSFTASPAYHDGKIYIGDIDGIFYCFDEQGELKWFYEAGSEISSANFYDGNVLFGSQDAKLYLLDSETGEKKWDLKTPDQIRCSVTVVKDRAFVAGCDGFFHIIDLKTGTEAGKVDIKSPTQSTPAVMDEKVFFGTEQDEFVAIDWKTAKGDWTFSDKGGPAPVRGCAAVTKGHVVFGARNRIVYSVDPESGEQNWAVGLKAKVDSSPVIVGQRVYVGSTDGRLYSLSLENGDKVWEKQFNGGFVSSPAVAFDKLVVATDRGVVYCLGKSKQ